MKLSLFFYSKQNTRKSAAGSYTSPSSPLFLSALPSLLLASILVGASLNTLWSNQLLVLCSTIVVSSYSNSYELMTIVAVVSCLLPAVSCQLNPNKFLMEPKIRLRNENAWAEDLVFG
ncbi:hypothetical protein ACTXT7_012460 [Hymenolepis weldensis]